MTDPKQQHFGLWSKQTISSVLRHIWRQNFIFVAMVAIGLSLLCLLLWPLYWEYQHKGPSFQLKAKTQVVNNHFGILQLAVHEPLSVRFTSSGGQRFQACCLDYGDGKLDSVVLSQKPKLSHTYEEAGTYVVSLLIWTNNLGETPRKQLLGQVEVDCPRKLELDYTAKIEQTEEGYQVQYESSVTGAPENEITYLWRLGDGKISTEASPLYTYPSAGEYAVSLSITRFLSTRYYCGDTAYLGGRLVLGQAGQQAVGLRKIAQGKEAPPSRQTQVRMRGWFISVMGLLFALLGIVSFWAGRWFLVNKRKSANELKALKPPGVLSLPTAHPQLFSDEKLFALSQALSHVESEGADGPGYLVLIERQAKEDLFARLMQELWTALQKEGVRVTFFFFQDNPNYYLDPQTDQLLPLDSLVVSHQDSHLILCTDGACLIDPYQKRLASWVSEILAPWSGRRYIFTPIPLEDWEEIESYLTREFVICPANQLLVLPGCIQTGQYQPAEIPRSDLIGWKNGLAYSSTGLQRYLGEPLFRWLQMTALWPQPSSDWVMHLADLFKPEDENFTYNSLIRLSRLSWMREGGLPPNLAFRWLANLPEQEERAARELLLQCLQKTSPPIGSVAELEKARFVTLQQFMLHPEKLPYAKAMYPIISQSGWNHTEQRLVHRKRKSLHGKSLGDYLRVRLGRLRTYAWSLVTGLGVTAIGVLGLHAGWQQKTHMGGNGAIISAKHHPIWHTEIWESETEELVALEERHPEEQVLLEVGETTAEDTLSVEPVADATLPCSEKESPMFLLTGRGLSDPLWIDKTVLTDFNRLKAYARDNGVEVKILQAFPTSPGASDFGRKMAIGRAFVGSLSYRKGIEWIACDGACLSAKEPPRPIRKFLEDLEKDSRWEWEVQSDKTSLHIWLNRFLPEFQAKERVYEFAEYWEMCGEAGKE